MPSGKERTSREIPAFAGMTEEAGMTVEAGMMGGEKDCLRRFERVIDRFRNNPDVYRDSMTEGAGMMEGEKEMTAEV